MYSVFGWQFGPWQACCVPRLPGCRLVRHIIAGHKACVSYVDFEGKGLAVASDQESRAPRRPASSTPSQPVTGGVRRPVRRRPVDKSTGSRGQRSLDPITGAQRIVPPAARATNAAPSTNAAGATGGVPTPARRVSTSRTSTSRPVTADAEVANSAAASQTGDLPVGGLDAPSTQHSADDAEWRAFLAKPSVILALRAVFAVLVVAIPILLGLGLFEKVSTGWSVLAVVGAVATWYGLRAGTAEQAAIAASETLESKNADRVVEEQLQRATKPPVKRRRVAFVDHGVAVTGPANVDDDQNEELLAQDKDAAATVESIVEDDVDDDESAVPAPSQDGAHSPDAAPERFLSDGDLVPVADHGVNASRVARPTSPRRLRSAARREWQPTPLPRPLYQLRQPGADDEDIIEAELPAPRPAITGSIEQVPPAQGVTPVQGSSAATKAAATQPSAGQPAVPGSAGVSSGVRGGPSRYDGANGARVTEQTIAVSAPVVDDLEDEELTEHTAAVRRRGRAERRVSLDLDSVLQQRRRASGE